MSNPLEINLTEHEMRMAAKVGVERRIRSIDMDDGYGGKDGWMKDVQGALGELVVSKALGRYWSGHVNKWEQTGDVGDGVEVRHTEPHDNNLIIREEDEDDFFYILVTGTAPDFKVHGFIQAREAKRNDQWKTDAGKDRPEMWLVPQDELAPIRSN